MIRHRYRDMHERLCLDVLSDSSIKTPSSLSNVHSNRQLAMNTSQESNGSNLAKDLPDLTDAQHQVLNK